MRPYLLLALLFATPLSAQLPIAVARQQPVQTIVTVIGEVTVAPGTFSSSADEGFAIQDQTGGIWISTKTRASVRMGQIVRVTGAVGANAKKVQIDPSDIRPERGLRIATGQVGAATAGFIITVEGTITRSTTDDAYGWKIWINDGSGEAQIFLNKGTRIDPHAAYLQPGRRIRVTGFSSQYEDDYEVDPRSRRDVVALR
ncbi:MAG TPA: DNA-binding protein [Thermoanaerobaculia bacterium]|jgi:uncharacterized protein YdeI (BOF family)